tara:strand:+ start:16923 stop:17165 length:243 start_codon:yes stop_codon:yes gene_type:complete
LKNKEEVVNHLIKKIGSISEEKRNLEDWCRKVLIDPEQDRAYIAIVAYRLALVELLEDIKGNNNERLFGENKSFKTRGRG